MIPQHQLEAIARVYGGILILGSLPNSPAQACGLRYGDILISVNGIRTKTIADFFAARVSNREHMRLVIVRDGVELELHIALIQGRLNLEEVRKYLEPGTTDSKDQSLPS